MFTGEMFFHEIFVEVLPACSSWDKEAYHQNGEGHECGTKKHIAIAIREDQFDCHLNIFIYSVAFRV